MRRLEPVPRRSVPASVNVSHDSPLMNAGWFCPFAITCPHHREGACGCARAPLAPARGAIAATAAAAAMRLLPWSSLPDSLCWSIASGREAVNGCGPAQLGRASRNARSMRGAAIRLRRNPSRLRNSKLSNPDQSSTMRPSRGRLSVMPSNRTRPPRFDPVTRKRAATRSRLRRATSSSEGGVCQTRACSPERTSRVHSPRRSQLGRRGQCRRSRIRSGARRMRHCGIRL
jgi:hypothetical protein